MTCWLAWKPAEFSHIRRAPGKNTAPAFFNYTCVAVYRLPIFFSPFFGIRLNAVSPQEPPAAKGIKLQEATSQSSTTWGNFGINSETGPPPPLQLPKSTMGSAGDCTMVKNRRGTSCFKTCLLQTAERFYPRVRACNTAVAKKPYKCCLPWHLENILEQLHMLEKRKQNYLCQGQME